MPDVFAILGLPRRPWLDEAAIKEAFQERARQCHPDAEKGNSEAFVALNNAHRLLADPALRLRLLVGDTPIPKMPENLQLGFQVGEIVRKVDKIIQKANSATNILSRALLVTEIEKIRREFIDFTVVLASHGTALENRLRELDASWPDIAIADIATLAGEYAFLSRWQEQVRERELAVKVSWRKLGSNEKSLS